MSFRAEQRAAKNLNIVATKDASFVSMTKSQFKTIVNRHSKIVNPNRVEEKNHSLP